MGFSSLVFIFIFLPISIAGNFILSKITRNNQFHHIYLILISLIFYWFGAGPEDLKILVFLTLLNYLLGYIIRTHHSAKAMQIGVLINTFILIYFKYPQKIFHLLGNADHLPKIIMPLGISFIIFHCISYLVDLYNNQQLQINHSEAEHFFNFAFYVLFFPKLLQGPIVCYDDFTALANSKKLNIDRFSEGIEKFISGLAKKVLLADELNIILVEISSLTAVDTISSWLIVILFGLRLYFDFSGYSTMAQGIALMLGYQLPNNFDRPYLSCSITEFWQRWHISLGHWLKKYVYIPLGGNRKGNVFLNLFLVFVISGLWHGNTKLYVLWGIAHGLMIVIERSKFYQKIDLHKTISRILGRSWTLFYVFVGWMCFYLPSFNAFYIFIKQLIGIKTSDLPVYFSYLYFLDTKTICLLIISIGLIIFSGTKMYQTLSNKLSSCKTGYFVKMFVLMILFILSFISINVNTYTPFIYFQY